MKLIVVAIVAIVISLAGAVVLGADSHTVAGAPVTEPVTVNDREFIASTDRVITMSADWNRNGAGSDTPRFLLS